MADDWRKPIGERVKNFTDILEKEKKGKGLPDKEVVKALRKRGLGFKSTRKQKELPSEKIGK